MPQGGVFFYVANHDHGIRAGQLRSQVGRLQLPGQLLDPIFHLVESESGRVDRLRRPTRRARLQAVGRRLERLAAQLVEPRFADPEFRADFGHGRFARHGAKDLP
jgi:hypothetical protein